jgi:hypothetical protein
MLGTTEWLHNLWPLEWYSAPQSYLFIYLFRTGLEPNPLFLRSFIGLLHQPRLIDDDDDDCGAISGMNEWQGKPKYRERTCPVSTTDTALLDQGTNSGHRDVETGTNLLSYGMASSSVLLSRLLGLCDMFLETWLIPDNTALDSDDGETGRYTVPQTFNRNEYQECNWG